MMNDGKTQQSHLSQSIPAEDFTYEPAKLVRPQQKWEMSRDHLIFGDICGLDLSKRHILHYLEQPKPGEHGGVLLTAAGNTVQILTLNSIPDTTHSRVPKEAVRSRQYLFGYSGGGIGSLAVHPSRDYFVVAEKGIRPNIYIYQYPTLQVYRVLKHGTEYAYSSVQFSADGEKLASVGGNPDFLLTVWAWRTEQTILRCKAFGQEVFSVQFSPNDNGFLTTSGVGHIRFWKMASTFTGLKLQGDIGKFGKCELSDIDAFCVLPDKKVLSSTERGMLLLWDGNFIKCEILTADRKLPHEGAIHVVLYEPAHHQIVTAGKDGWIKWWDLDAIDHADVAEDDTVACIPVRDAVYVGDNVDIRALVRGDDHYLIQDAAGSIHRLTISSSFVHLHYLNSHAGRITGIATSPCEHFAASSGEDGSVRCWDYITRQCVFSQLHSQAASAICWVPNTASYISTDGNSSRARQVVVGFQDGVVRVLLMDLARKVWVRTNVFKPHEKRVTCLSYSPSGSYLVTGSEDGTLFILQVVDCPRNKPEAKYPPEYQPVGFQRVAVTTGSTTALSCISWRSDSEALLVTTRDGHVLEYALSDLKNYQTDDRETFELQLPQREYQLKRVRSSTMKELKDLEASTPINVDEKGIGKVEISITKPSGLCAVYAPDQLDKETSFFLTAQDPFGGFVYLCKWGQALPIKEYPSEAAVAFSAITSLSVSSSKRLLLCGLSNGKYQLRSTQTPQAFLTAEFHDGVTCAIAQVATSYDDSYVLAAGKDGQLSISRINVDTFEFAAKNLHERHEKMIAEALIVKSQAFEKQKAQLDMLKAAQAQAQAESGESSSSAKATDEAAAFGVHVLPSFVAAKAYAAHIEGFDTRDEEAFGGVVRLLSDSIHSAALVPAVSPLDPDLLPTFVAYDTLTEEVDVSSTDAYTIQDAKLKLEADARAMSTMTKQDRTRQVIASVREAFQRLRQADLENPIVAKRLDDEEWEIDLDYGELLLKQGDAACEEVRKELAYVVEQEELLLIKMRDAFVSNVAVELITLRAFESGLSVQSFRTTKMPPTLKKRLNEIHMDLQAMRKRQASMGMMVESGGGGNVPRLKDSQHHHLFSRNHSVLDLMSKEVALHEKFPLKDEEKRMIQAAQAGAIIPPGAPHLIGDERASASNTTTISSGVSVHGFEARKRMRADRKDRLAQWQANKPGEDADDPRDLVAIAYAQRNMGDYKLKTAPNYVVPEDQRVNAAKKRRQMALVEEKLYETKLQFNAKVLELRELKLHIIEELQHDQRRIALLQQALKGEEKEEVEVFHIAVDMREWPEQRERVTDADVKLYQREHKVLPFSEAVEFSTMRKMSTALASGLATTTSKARASLQPDGAAHRKAQQLAGEPVEKGALPTDSSDLDLDALQVRHITVNELSNTALQERIRQKRKMQAATAGGDVDEAKVRVFLMRQEIEKLLHKRRAAIAEFDDAVYDLRREKMKLDVVFKKSELRLFTLLSELVLLEQFESKENLLSSKLEKNKTEKAQIVGEIDDIQVNLTQKRTTLDELTKNEKQIQSEFHTLVGAAHPAVLALQKIFKKKIKRPKKRMGLELNGGKNGGEATNKGDKPGENDEEDEEEDDDDDYDDENDDDDDDDDDDDEEDVCPVGCDMVLYEKVIALREKRADVDEATAEILKHIEELKRTNDRQVGKQRQIDKELQAAEQDIQLFQSEKQTRFNQLDVVVALSTHQIRCLQAKEPTSNPSPSPRATASYAARCSMELPENASNCLVFNLKLFDALGERIESLQKENRLLRQQFKDLHKQQSVLAKDKKVQHELIAAIQDKCEQLQLLKFGQLIDIEVLDKACDSSLLTELKSKAKKKEVECGREFHHSKHAQQQLKLEVLRATQENTRLLSQIASLNERQFALEKELNQTNVNQSLCGDETQQLEQEMAERNKLVKLVKLQAREMDALKQEIGLLRGKDGKVYAPK